MNQFITFTSTLKGAGTHWIKSNLSACAIRWAPGDTGISDG